MAKFGSQTEVIEVQPKIEAIYALSRKRLAVWFLVMIGFAIGVTAGHAQSLAYITTAFGDSVLVVDAATNAIIETIPVGNDPFAVAFSPNGIRAYVTNFSMLPFP